MREDDSKVLNCCAESMCTILDMMSFGSVDCLYKKIVVVAERCWLGDDGGANRRQASQSKGGEARRALKRCQLDKHPINMPSLSLAPAATPQQQHLTGLALSRSERILVVALSYTWCLPLFLSFGQRIWLHLRHLALPRRPNNRH